ncbi:MAG: HAD family hydrolase [Acidobacteriota bacterium]|nr:MAG: HAD family hydrolase [Acidobacteriota bacterium]
MKTLLNRPGILLDRDGTLVEEVNYLQRIEDIQFIPGAEGAVRRANRFGIPVIVISNQSGVARGMLSEEAVQSINRFIQDSLTRNDARIEAFYYCPHHPEIGDDTYRKDCSCRKPKPGMLLQAAEDFSLDLSQCVMIGDSYRDLEAGHSVGCAGVLVLTGHGRRQYDETRLQGQTKPSDFVATDIGEAIDWAIERIQGRVK